MNDIVRVRRRIGLVDHDSKKDDLVEWAPYNRHELVRHDLFATRTTGTILEEALGVGIVKLQSGPLGGDLQIGGLIADGAVDLLVFFWDPLEAQPHDPDVKALLRVAVVWNVPVACDRATADFLVSSPLMASDYTRALPDYQAHIARLATPRSLARPPHPPISGRISTIRPRRGPRHTRGSTWSRPLPRCSRWAPAPLTSHCVTPPPAPPSAWPTSTTSRSCW